MKIVVYYIVLFRWIYKLCLFQLNNVCREEMIMMMVKYRHPQRVSHKCLEGEIYLCFWNPQPKLRETIAFLMILALQNINNGSKHAWMAPAKTKQWRFKKRNSFKIRYIIRAYSFSSLFSVVVCLPLFECFHGFMQSILTGRTLLVIKLSFQFCVLF